MRGAWAPTLAYASDTTLLSSYSLSHAVNFVRPAYLVASVAKEGLIRKRAPRDEKTLFPALPVCYADCSDTRAR